MTKPLLTAVNTAASAAFRERSRPFNRTKDLGTMPEGVALREACKAALEGGCDSQDVHSILKAVMGPMAGDAHALMIPQMDKDLSDATQGGQEEEALPRPILKGEEDLEGGMDAGGPPPPPTPEEDEAGEGSGEPIMKAHVAAHTRNVHGKLVHVQDYDTANRRSEGLTTRSGRLAAGRNNRHPFSTAHNATTTAHSATNRAHLSDSMESHIAAERLHRNAARIHTEAAKVSGKDEAPEHQALAQEHHAMADHHGALAYGTMHETAAAGGESPAKAPAAKDHANQEDDDRRSLGAMQESHMTKDKEGIRLGTEAYRAAEAAKKDGSPDAHAKAAEAHKAAAEHHMDLHADEDDEGAPHGRAFEAHKAAMEYHQARAGRGVAKGSSGKA
jgi:hypothetical protein